MTFKGKNLTTTNPIDKDKQFFSSLGDSFMSKNEYKKALKGYLSSLMLGKNDSKAQLSASKAYKNLKEYDKAIKHLKEARNIFSFDYEIYYELGINYLLNDDSVNAKKNFIRTIKLAPKNLNAQIKLALTHELSDEEDMAILVYKTIIEKNPDFLPAYSNLASLYIELGEFENAINVFKKILRINNEYYRAFLGIGLCFDKMGKYIYAVRFYKKYISFKPNSQTSKSLVGRIYEIMKIIKLEKTDKNKTRVGLKIISNH